jgi:hypothetical protein
VLLELNVQFCRRIVEALEVQKRVSLTGALGDSHRSFVQDSFEMMILAIAASGP